MIYYYQILRAGHEPALYSFLAIILYIPEFNKNEFKTIKHILNCLVNLRVERMRLSHFLISTHELSLKTPTVVHRQAPSKTAFITVAMDKHKE